MRSCGVLDAPVSKCRNIEGSECSWLCPLWSDLTLRWTGKGSKGRKLVFHQQKNFRERHPHDTAEFKFIKKFDTTSQRLNKDLGAPQPLQQHQKM